MTKLTLYLSPGSSSMAPHIALNEVGADFEIRPTLLSKGDNKTPAYLAINPEGKVPTLTVDGRPMTEVAAILFYIAKTFPEAGLLPAGVEGEAQAISWMSFVASSVHPARARGEAACREALGWRSGGWTGGTGRSGPIRRPTSTCSAWSGGSAGCSTSTSANSPAFQATTTG